MAIMASGFIWPPGTWWGMALLCIACAQMSFVCAVISHNTMHVPVFRPKPLNKFMQVLLTVTTGDPVSAFVPSHNLGHHTHLQTAKDAMRTSKLRFRWNFLNQLLFTFVVGGDVMKGTYRYIWAMRTRKRTWFNQWALEMSALAVVFVTLPFINLSSFVLYIFVPYVFSSWGIIGINFVHDTRTIGTTTRAASLAAGSTGGHSTTATTRCTTSVRGCTGPTCRPRTASSSHRTSSGLEQKSLLMYCFRAYIWPGHRLTYDGKPLVSR